MLYKARQAESTSGQTLSAKDKQPLALQVSDHKKGSDTWTLIPYRSDSVSTGDLSKHMTDIMNALAMYVNRVIGHADPSGSVTEMDLLGLSIYSDTKSLVDRVNDGIISKIEIMSPATISDRPLVIDLEVKEFVHSLKDRTIAGPDEELTGILSKLDFDRAVADVHVGLGQTVKIKLDDRSIDRLRREAPKNSQVTLLGTPIYRFGTSYGKYDRFEAQRIISIKPR
jgi:hypothetical protein